MRADSKLVKVFYRGQLIKVHPRSRPANAAPTPRICRRTRPPMPCEISTTCAAWPPAEGDAIGVYADALLGGPLPWTKMRQVYALLGLVKKWGPERVDAACAKALEAETVNVGLIGRMIERAARAPTSPCRCRASCCPVASTETPANTRSGGGER